MSVLAAIESARTRSWLSSCEKVGEGTRLLGRPTVDAEGGAIRIGDRFRLASRPVPSHLVAGPEGVLEIGHDVSIGHGAAIAAFQHVRIGDGTRIGPFVIVMDTNFHGQPGDQSVRHDCRPVVIGSRCRIGSRVTITRGASVGDDAEILAQLRAFAAAEMPDLIGRIEAHKGAEPLFEAFRVEEQIDAALRRVRSPISFAALRLIRPKSRWSATV